MAGCSDCKFHNSELGEFVNGRFEISHKCAQGKTSQTIKWWNDNGKKVRGRDEIDNMDCHDYHDTTKHLMAANEATDKLLELLKNKP